MASILGIGNALTDILAVLPDDKFLKEFHLPKGSMQHVDMETGDKIWQTLKPMGVQLVAGGSAANTITGTAIFGMESGFIGKVGDDDLGHLFKSDQEQYGIKSMLFKGTKSSGKAMVFITALLSTEAFPAIKIFAFLSKHSDKYTAISLLINLFCKMFLCPHLLDKETNGSDVTIGETQMLICAPVWVLITTCGFVSLSKTSCKEVIFLISAR